MVIKKEELSLTINIYIYIYIYIYIKFEDEIYLKQKFIQECYVSPLTLE
jgi:hypothetical protein